MSEERTKLNQPTCYASRDLEELGKYYFRHFNAMTREGLDSKSSIAAELAVRDMIIDDLLSKHNAIGMAAPPKTAEKQSPK